MEKQEQKTVKMSMGPMATQLIVASIVEKVKRGLGEEGKIVHASSTEMETYAVQIFQQAIDLVTGGEPREMDEERLHEISSGIIVHRFKKGMGK